MSGATEYKYINDIRATLLPNDYSWVVKADTPIKFDFSWRPDPFDPPYNYVFGNDHWEGQRSATVEYRVPGATETKYVENVLAELGDLDIFYVDKMNSLSKTRSEELSDRGINFKTTRYVNSMMETIKRCANKSSTGLFWVISSENDYSEFDFKWQPEPWQRSMTHVFGSKWSKWSDTFLVNRNEFMRHTEWAKGIEQFPNLNFVQNQLVTTSDDSSAMYYIEHGNPESPERLVYLKKRYPNIRSTRFVDNYLDTFKRIMETATTENVWIISSLCNYHEFDFTWHPSAWEREQIHCFSNYGFEEKRGDTFYIHVESFKAQMYELAILDWFNVINYHNSLRVYRDDAPVHRYEGDNLVQAILDYDFKTPYVYFTQQNQRLLFSSPSDDSCLWTEKDRVVYDLNTSKATSMVPRDVKKYLKTQMYDYPYLFKGDDLRLPRNVYMDDPLDVIYISNGEPDAEKYYEHLYEVVHNQRHTNHLKRVQFVNGRIAAYQAAARLSTTPWFFAVFAKLEVESEFDFNWQPDYWQEPKHYIFNARNPVNGLEYGHMGMIAYNKRLVLENNNPGIDFTLSQAHESVPLLSGVAHYNQDAWTTWRTAFREVLKLRMFMDTNPTLETEHRLATWQTEGTGEYCYISKNGAQDALAYYDEVKGDPAKLQLSFDWAWLSERFNRLYNGV
jgi:hypothetical protein